MPVARFSVICEECIRIEWSSGPGEEHGRFVDEPSMFAAARPLPRRIVIADAAAGAPPVEVRTSRCTVRFRPDGKPFHAGNLDAQIALPSANGRRFSFWRPGDRNAQNLGGTIETLDGIRGPVPIGEGLLARDGWHLIDDSHGHLLVKGWVAARTWRGIPTTNTDWYLFAYGHDYAAAFRALSRVSGPVPVPRRAALGSWYSRYWPHTSAEFRGIVADYHQHGIPLDIMVLDMDWHSGSARDRWTGWSWNRELLPDAEELLDWLHAQGLSVALNLHPADGVRPDEDRYAAFMRAQGADAHTGERLAFDAGNRGYMTALFNEVLAPLEDRQRNDKAVVRGAESEGAPRGVDFWWLDWQQERFVPSIAGLTNLAWLNSQFYRHSAREGRRGISLSRWAGMGFGDHRHPVHFSGDAHTGWEMLAFQVPFTVAAGNAGCFYWSHDIGGHFGPRIEECTARWCWFGALSAAMRLHSARTAALDRRPWTYAEPFAGAMRSAFALRASLMPVIDRAAHECEELSLPLLRPMCLAHPQHERAYRAHAQYTIGRDLLAAPITSPGVGPRRIAAARVWFPPGAAWFNWFTHERYEPGAEAAVAAPIDEAPLFAPAGVPILTRGFSHRPATEPIDHLIIRLYPGAPGTTHTRELHEDDGDTTAYRRGEFRRTPVTSAWSGSGRLTLTVGPSRGTFPHAPASRDVTLALGACSSVSGISINGRPAAAVADPRAGLVHIHAASVAADSALLIEADVEGLAPAEQSQHNRRCREARAAELPAQLDSASLADALSITLAAKFGIGAWPESDSPAGVGRPDAVRICDPFASINSGTFRAELIERVGSGAGGSRVLRDCFRTPSQREGAVGGRAFDSVPMQSLRAGELQFTGASAVSVPLPVDELPEPPHGLRAARAVRLSFSIGAEQFDHEVPAETRIRPLTGFVARGPFPWDWRRSIEEQAFDPEAAPLAATDLAAWVRTRRGEKWPVDFRLAFPAAKGLAYAATILRSEHEQQTTLHLESGDKIEAWLNGSKVFSLDGHDSAAALDSSVRVRLPAGDSILLIKTNDGGGGWGFAATLDGEHEVRCITPGGGD